MKKVGSKEMNSLIWTLIVKFAPFRWSNRLTIINTDGVKSLPLYSISLNVLSLLDTHHSIWYDIFLSSPMNEAPSNGSALITTKTINLYIRIMIIQVPRCPTALSHSAPFTDEKSLQLEVTSFHSGLLGMAC